MVGKSWDFQEVDTAAWKIWVLGKEPSVIVCKQILIFKDQSRRI